MFGNPKYKRMSALLQEVFLTLILFDIMWIHAIFMNMYLKGILVSFLLHVELSKDESPLKDSVDVFSCKVACLAQQGKVNSMLLCLFIH